MTSDFNIVDLVKYPEIRDSVYRQYIRYSNIYQDDNKHIYDELWERIDDYPVFHVVYDRDGILGMSGVNDFYWSQPGVARIMDRAYQFRRDSNFSNRVSQYLIPLQIEYCLKSGIHTMFMSFEKERRMKFYQKHYLDKHFPQFKIQPHRYNVCPQRKVVNCDSSCWQSITVYHATDDRSFMLPILKE